MVHLINANTGTDMWVDETRVDEYLAAGHKPAAASGVSEMDHPKPKPKTKAKKPKE